MQIVLVCPAPPGSRVGNRITAARWRRLLAQLGHRARIVESVEHVRRWDVLVALHARRSAASIALARERAPERPIVVVLTGTDLYRDLPRDPDARRSLDLADAIAVLHPLAWRAVPEEHRDAIVVVPQSAKAPPRAWSNHERNGAFDVAVVGHLRPEKDPLRAPLAARLLPRRSRIRILHAGRALDQATAREAEREAARNPRYVLLGELAPAAARRLIADSRLFVLTSRLEGGANVISEALVAGAPILSTRIDAAEALLGEDHPGLFPVGDTRALADLLRRAEDDPTFLRELAARSRRRRSLVSERAEKTALRRMLAAAEAGRSRRA